MLFFYPLPNTEGSDYEQRLIYLHGLGNLQLANVPDYLDPIIRDESQSTDIRFLAIIATMPLVHERSEKVRCSTFLRLTIL